jgi:hypothetical protein
MNCTRGIFCAMKTENHPFTAVCKKVVWQNERLPEKGDKRK